MRPCVVPSASIRSAHQCGLSRTGGIMHSSSPASTRARGCTPATGLGAAARAATSCRRTLRPRCLRVARWSTAHAARLEVVCFSRRVWAAPRGRHGRAGRRHRAAVGRRRGRWGQRLRPARRRLLHLATLLRVGCALRSATVPSRVAPRSSATGVRRTGRRRYHLSSSLSTGPRRAVTAGACTWRERAWPRTRRDATNRQGSSRLGRRRRSPRGALRVLRSRTRRGLFWTLYRLTTLTPRFTA